MPEQLKLKFRTIPLWLIVVLCALSAGCGGDFDAYAIKERAERGPVLLDSEEVTLNTTEIDCGVANELWGAPSAGGGARVIYRLTDKARDLHFSDDIYANDAGFDQPHTQVRGKFQLQLDRVVAVNGPNAYTRLVQAQIGVRIPHPCFPTPLRIMGVRKGKFAPDEAPTLLYEAREDGWQAAHIVH